MEVTLVTTSINVDILNIKGLNIPDVDFQKPIKLLVNVQNNGNTEIAPSKIILEIQDLTKNLIETQEVTKLEKTAPNTTKEITAEFKNNLNGGEYFGVVKVYLDDKLLRSDRLVFKVGNPPEGYKPSTSKGINFLTKIISTVKQNKTETTVALIIPLFPALIGFILFKKSKFGHLKIIFFIATVAYLILAFSLINVYHRNRLVNMAKPEDKGNVQGETIEITPTNIPKTNSQSSLIINNDTANYPIYRIPDINSNVVYVANENEKLSVVSEQEGWYQVLTGKGTGGWLPKTSVKKTQ